MKHFLFINLVLFFFLFTEKLPAGSCSETFLSAVVTKVNNPLLYEKTSKLQDEMRQILEAPPSSQSKISRQALQQKLTEHKILAQVQLQINTSNQVFIVLLEGGVVAIFKPSLNDGSQVRSEVATYLLDQSLGFSIVPITIERALDGKTGSLQFFIKDGIRADEKGSPPLSLELSILDFLIANTDRHNENYLILPSGKQIAIDHGYSFDFSSTLPEVGEIKPLQDQIRAASNSSFFIERLKALKESELKTSLSPLIGVEKVGILLQRRDLLLNGLSTDSPGTLPH